MKGIYDHGEFRLPSVRFEKTPPPVNRPTHPVPQSSFTKRLRLEQSARGIRLCAIILLACSIGSLFPAVFADHDWIWVSAGCFPLSLVMFLFWYLADIRAALEK